VLELSIVFFFLSLVLEFRIVMFPIVGLITIVCVFAATIEFLLLELDGLVVGEW
jgi:hypothetical protein